MIGKKQVMERVPMIFKKVAGDASSLYKKGRPIFDVIEHIMPEGNVRKAAKVVNCLERA